MFLVPSVPFFFDHPLTMKPPRLPLTALNWSGRCDRLRNTRGDLMATTAALLSIPKERHLYHLPASGRYKTGILTEAIGSQTQHFGFGT